MKTFLHAEYLLLYLYCIPAFHRDSFLAKVPRPCPVHTSGNTTSLYCRAVRLSKNLIVSLQPKNKTFPNKI
jgi:hypothetical protein